MLPLAEAELNYRLESQAHKLIFFIVCGKVANLLGINACQDLGLVTFGPAVHKISPAEGSTQQILFQYKEQFDDKLGKLPIKYNITTISRKGPDPKHYLSMFSKNLPELLSCSGILGLL